MQRSSYLIIWLGYKITMLKIGFKTVNGELFQRFIILVFIQGTYFLDVNGVRCEPLTWSWSDKLPDHN